MISKKAALSVKSTPVIARESDGTVQINLTIPSDQVQKAEEETLSEIANNVSIPGFRPGKAPLEEVRKKVSAQDVLEGILGKVIPPAYRQVVQENNLHPVLNPKLELVQAEKGQDWQIRALTCEIPNVELGDYKKELAGIKRTNDLWVPGKDDKEQKVPTNEEKENLVLNTLLKTAKVTVSRLLIEEEVNHRLAGLVDQTQKLGLSVDEYLARTNRTVETIKQEYTQQAETQVKLMILLSHVAQEERVTVSDKEINEALQKTTPSEAQREVIRGVLLRRHALDILTTFV